MSELRSIHRTRAAQTRRRVAASTSGGLWLGLPLAAAAMVIGGCANGDADSKSSASDTTAATSAAPKPSSAVDEPEVSEETQPKGLTDQFGQRYCEVLAISVSDAGTVGEVWGTQGINDCPQELFATMDSRAIAAELGTNAAVLNGPRYWTLDRIVANELAGSMETRVLGGMPMRSIATIEFGDKLPDRTPLSETSVARDTEFVFSKGREIHELTSPDGSVYVMQSYSIELDPDLTADMLSALGPRLDLPDGWSFASRVVEEDLVVEDIDGTATVIQDKFRNSYQLRARP